MLKYIKHMETQAEIEAEIEVEIEVESQGIKLQKSTEEVYRICPQFSCFETGLYWCLPGCQKIFYLLF